MRSQNAFLHTRINFILLFQLEPYVKIQLWFPASTLSPVSYANGMKEPSRSKHDGPSLWTLAIMEFTI